MLRLKWLSLVLVVIAVFGCTKDENAEVRIVLGCMDRQATNYNPEATQSDGACIFPKPKYVVFSRGDWMGATKSYGFIECYIDDERFSTARVVVNQYLDSVDCATAQLGNNIADLRLDVGKHTIRFEAFRTINFQPELVKTWSEDVDIPGNRYFCEAIDLK